MPIFHCSARRLQRSVGHSATGAIAYMLDLRMIDPRTGITHNQTHRHKHEIDFVFIGPVGFDTTQSPASFAAGIDLHEMRKDATVGKEYQIALLRELSPEQNREAVRSLCRLFADEGRACLASFHWKKGQFHTHIFVSDRDWTSGGWGKKDKKHDQPTHLKKVREAWGRCANAALKDAGCKERIDHRSYRERGIDLMPERKQGKFPSIEVLEHNTACRAERESQKCAALLRTLAEERNQVDHELRALEDGINSIDKVQLARQARKPKSQAYSVQSVQKSVVLAVRSVVSDKRTYDPLGLVNRRAPPPKKSAAHLVAKIEQKVSAKKQPPRKMLPPKTGHGPTYGGPR